MQQNSLISISKILVGSTWLFATACFFAPLQTTEVGPFGRTLFWVLAAVHVVECVAFLGILRKSPRPLVGELWQTFLFGIVHVSIVRKEIEEGGSPSSGA
ncbi:MAG TPA: hypothetical protein VKA74_07310 [Myxococcota bacterium]|nr:hypothetical protein [Myxococcota bacterium]